MVKSHDSCVENCLRYYAPSLAKVLWMGFFKGERKLLRRFESFKYRILVSNRDPVETVCRPLLHIYSVVKTFRKKFLEIPEMVKKILTDRTSSAGLKDQIFHHVGNGQEVVIFCKPSL